MVKRQLSIYLMVDYQICKHVIALDFYIKIQNEDSILYGLSNTPV